VSPAEKAELQLLCIMRALDSPGAAVYLLLCCATAARATFTSWCYARRMFAQGENIGACRVSGDAIFEIRDAASPSWSHHVWKSVLCNCRVVAADFPHHAANLAIR